MASLGAATTPSASLTDTSNDEALAPIRARMRASADSKDWAPGAEALLELAGRAPLAFEEGDTRRAAALIAGGIALDEKNRNLADKVFDVLANKLGGAGLDILYDIVSTRGASEAAKRAGARLREKPVLERTAPPLRIAIELREAPSCRERLALLDRAKTDGDSRAAAVLEIWRSQSCIPGAGECCFSKNKAVDEALSQIRARARSSSTQ